METLERVAEERSGAMATQGSLAERLLERIATRQARVGLIGLGYAGLPLAVAYA